MTNSEVTLEKGVDYILAYRDNVNPGTATGMVQGVGKNYTGAVFFTFEIEEDPAKPIIPGTPDPSVTDPGQTGSDQGETGQTSPEGTLANQKKNDQKNKVKIAAPTILKAKKNGTRTLKVAWKKVRGASGYEIWCSSKKSFKSGVKKKKVKASVKSVKIKKLKKSKEWYVRIRSCKKVSGKKIFSSWSKVKKVKK